MTAPALLEVGRIGKAHGLRGEVSVLMVSDRPERVAPAAVLSTARGDLVVEHSRPHQGRYIVKFAGIADRTAAESWHGTVLLAEPIEDPDALFVHDLIGRRVIDADGVDRGLVVSLQSNPASDLLVLENDALVPLNFVTNSEIEGEIHVDTPDGLFELFED